MRLVPRLLLVSGLCLGPLCPTGSRAQAEDPAPVPAPAPAPSPDPERVAELARADALWRQAGEHFGAARYAEALGPAREALAIRRRVLGDEHPDVARTMIDLGVLLVTRRELAEAQAVLRQALALQEQRLGADHPDLAESLVPLAQALERADSLAEATAVLERALALRERALGSAHPLVAEVLTNLGRLARQRGQVREARARLERALAALEAARGPEHPSVAQALSSLAEVLMDQGEATAAVAALERALDLQTRALGAAHPAVATSLLRLGRALQEQGQYPASVARCQQAVRLYSQVYGADDARTSTALLQWSSVLQDMGLLAEARVHAERAVRIREARTPKGSLPSGHALLQLAALLSELGEQAGARRLGEEAFAILLRHLGEDHPAVAGAHVTLGQVAWRQGALAEARSRFEQALVLLERGRQGSPADLGAAGSNLGMVLLALGEPVAARAACERAVGVLESALGELHPLTLRGLGNLAAVVDSLGDHSRSRVLFERVLSAREALYGRDDSSAAGTLAGLARSRERAGALAEARSLYARALAAAEAAVRGRLEQLGPRQRGATLAALRRCLIGWCRLTSRLGESGYPGVLRLKGLVARAEAAERLLERRATEAERDLVVRLDASRHLLARLANGVPSAFEREKRAVWQRRYLEASAERERLTLELARRSAPLRGALERLDLGLPQVQGALGAHTALVDLLRVGDRYLAWVVRPQGEPERLDLGPAEEVERAAQAFLAAIADEPDQASGSTARAAAGDVLASRVWTPVAARLGAGVKRVVVCPDAALAGVPFAALPGSAPGTFLLDDLVLVHVASAQEVVPDPGLPPLGQGALLVGGVDYDRAEAGAPATGAGAPPAAGPSGAPLDRAPRGVSFRPLPQTRLEVERLRARLGAASVTLLGAAATEAALRAGARGRRLLHVATHGFVREDLLVGLRDRRVGDDWTSADEERQLVVGHDPLVLAGLALAGANPRAGGGDDDGVLTALEASHLDLDGLDLVTLSACETARGTVESGEGVQGLVQGFRMAGARRVLASLWPVDDEATRLLMESLYERLLGSERPLDLGEALREAARALRAIRGGDGRPRFAAPRYWAAFLAYGG